MNRAIGQWNVAQKAHILVANLVCDIALQDLTPCYFADLDASIKLKALHPWIALSFERIRCFIARPDPGSVTPDLHCDPGSDPGSPRPDPGSHR
jgi:hypothetical protein